MQIEKIAFIGAGVMGHSMITNLLKAGFKVRETRPRPDDDPQSFIPEYFVTGVLMYRTRGGSPVK